LNSIRIKSFPAFAAPTLVGICLLALLVAACAGGPVFREERDGVRYIPMEPGGTAYIFVDIGEARPIINLLSFRGMDTGDRQLQQILDITDSAVAGIYAEEREGIRPGRTRFRVLTRGNYPSGLAGLAFGASRGWEERRSGAVRGRQGRYWHSPEAFISVAIASKQAAISSSLPDLQVDPLYVGGGTRIPEGFEAFRSKGVFSAWVENPREFLAQRLREMNLGTIQIPAEDLFLNISPVQAGDGGEVRYVAHMQIRVANSLLARNLQVALFVSRNLLASAARGHALGAFIATTILANPATANGSHLHIRTNPMSVEDISRLIQQLSS